MPSKCAKVKKCPDCHYPLATVKNPEKVHLIERSVYTNRRLHGVFICGVWCKAFKWTEDRRKVTCRRCKQSYWWTAKASHKAEEK